MLIYVSNKLSFPSALSLLSCPQEKTRDAQIQHLLQLHAQVPDSHDHVTLGFHLVMLSVMSIFQVDVDLENEPIGLGKDGDDVYLRDIWPSNEEITEVNVLNEKSH